MHVNDVSTYRNELYGVSILWIMFYHAIVMVNMSYTGISGTTFWDTVLGYGNIGSDIFLFCSGILLYYSYHRKPDAGEFMKKRFIRVALPTWFINIGYWYYRYVIVKQSWPKFWSRMTLLDFWTSTDTQIWFVSFILICYLLYPYIYSLLFKSKFANSFVRLCILMGISIIIPYIVKLVNWQYYDDYNIAITRLPVFILGCYFGKMAYEKTVLPWWTYLILLAATVLVFGYEQLGIFDESIVHRYIYIITAVGLTYLFCLIFRFFRLIRLTFINKIIGFFGWISLNLYLSHYMLCRLYKEHDIYDHRQIWHYFWLLALSIPIALACEGLVVLCTRRRKKANPPETEEHK